MTAWIDYLITSDDPADEALLDEFRNLAWARGQLMQLITSDPAIINAETFAKMDEGQKCQNELQARIRARGEALHAIGRSPCDDAAFNAWRASWVSLAGHPTSKDSEAPH